MNYLGLDCVMMIIIKLLLKCSELFFFKWRSGGLSPGTSAPNISASLTVRSERSNRGQNWFMGNWSSHRKGACTFQKFWNFWDGACYARYFWLFEYSQHLIHPAMFHHASTLFLFHVLRDGFTGANIRQVDWGCIAVTFIVFPHDIGLICIIFLGQQ